MAAKWYLESIDIREKVLGKEHPDYAASLGELASLYKDIGQYEKAEQLYLDAIAIQEKTLGREHSDCALNLHNLAGLYHYTGRYNEAEQLYLEAKAIWEKVLGKEHRYYIFSLINLALLYSAMGQYEEVELHFLEAIDIQEKTQGREHPDLAFSLDGLAGLYRTIGQFDKAEPLALEARDIWGKTLGKDHPNYARGLYNLAAGYKDMGQYEKAEPLLLEAKGIWEKALGKGNVYYALSLSGLALLYNTMGQYEKAEPLYLEAKTIWENTLGKENPNYAANLSNLAVLYRNLGQYDKAEPLTLEAKDIQEKTLGRAHPAYAESVIDLAILYRDMGQYEKAEQLFLNAKTIMEESLGRENPSYATSLNDLATLYFYMGQYEKSEQLFLDAKHIREKNLDMDHPDYAGSLLNLASLYTAISQYDKAEPLYLEAKAIWDKKLGKEHLENSLNLRGLITLYKNIGQYEKAELFIFELSSVTMGLIEKSVSHLSERELNNYIKIFSDNQNLTLSLIQIVNTKKSTHVIYNNNLFYKGFLLNASNRIKQLALTDSTSSDKYYRLRGYHRRLAGQYALPIIERDSALVAELESKANDLEKDLARTVAGFGEATRQVNWQEVKAALKPQEAAIEFVHYRYYEKKATDSTMYAALILRPSDPQPLFIPLFEEKQLATTLQPAGEKTDSKTLAQVYTRGVKPLKGSNSNGLFELLWQPLDSLLLDVKTVYYSPSGLLHRINFDGIPIPVGAKSNNEILADRFRLVRLGSTRSLVVPDFTKTNSTNDAALFGGIQYEIDITALAKDTTVQDFLAIHAGELSFTYADRSVPQRSENWNYLPGTAQEITKIQALLRKAAFSPRIFSGEAATEEVFKTIGNSQGVTSSHPLTGSPRILHLATHGFFFPDPQSEAPSPGRGLGEVEPVFKISDHPMIRSGLILAGGNHAWQTGKPLRPGMEDGIITAYEISQMNLSNTELVVLSACETGLGDIHGNEGVYGLQRAFKIAGAKYLIMSLWQVPDRETSVFMETFYRHWIEGKITIPDAFRRTQQEMRERFINPYQWAGFVLVE